MNNNTIVKLESLLKQKKFAELKKILQQDSQYIPDLMSRIPSLPLKIMVFRMAPKEIAAEIFIKFSAKEQLQMLEDMTSGEVQAILNEMPVDERIALFEEMPAEIVKKLMLFLYYDQRDITRKILNYPEDSVGRLMTPSFIQLYENMTANTAIEHIRKFGLKKETIYYCYVLDSERKLTGVVSLKKIILAQPETLIKEIMFRSAISVNVYEDKEKVTHIFKEHDLLAIPVVNNDDKLLGIVTFDDLVDVMDDETTEDFQKIAAVLPIEKSYLEASLFSIFYKRSFWLIFLIILGSLSGFVIQAFQPTIQKWIALSFFLPMLIATAGNAGTQSATIVIRGLATEEIKIRDFLKVITRESILGILLGGILALTCIFRVFFQEYNWALSFSVGISMGLTVIISAVIGASLPVLLNKIKLDPALMSGPLLTTIIDIVGIVIYFNMAGFILTQFFKT
ncbi:MAG: magnesium transporter [Candidatus Omnitrophica bacterium]|nr:magnesium transporter [Candidatus Omnitrophota bacterium]